MTTHPLRRYCTAHRRYTSLIVGMLLTVAFTGCFSPRPTPTPTPNAIAKQATINARINATGTAAVASGTWTAQPVPTRLASGTTLTAVSQGSRRPASTAKTPVPPVPANWLDYTALDRSFTLSYPPSWRITRETSCSVVFENPSDQLVAMLSYVDAPALEASDSAISDLVETLAQAQPHAYLRIKDSGAWSDDAHPGVYAEILAVKDNQSFVHTLGLVWALPTSHCIQVAYSRAGVGDVEVSDPAYQFGAKDLAVLRQISASLQP